MLDLRTREDVEDALQDYLNALYDVQNKVERCIRFLLRNPSDAEQINSLFRHVHTLKSNAAMCRLDFLVEFAHPLEDVMGAVRAGELPLTPLLAEIFLMGVDRIRLAAEMASMHQPMDILNLRPLSEAMSRLAQMDVAGVAIAAPRLIAMFGGTVAENVASEPVASPVVAAPAAPVGPTNHEALAADLALFRQLAVMTECHSPFWQGRTERVVALAKRVNELAGTPIDPCQLEAAVYMHDVGMSFLSESIWTKQGKLNDIELRELRAHPATAYELLRRMPGWEQAAVFALQHHERPDGRGYPSGLQGDDISEGAKVLAIVDAFEAMTNERGDRYHKRSILRAVTEINASDGQFARSWIPAFNAASRELIAASNS